LQRGLQVTTFWKDTKTGPFAKSLFMFPVGMHLVETVAAKQLQKATDQRYSTELTGLLRISERATAILLWIEKAEKDGEGRILRMGQVQQQQWIDFHKRLVALEANSSKAFQSDHKDSISRLRSHLETVHRDIEAAARADFWRLHDECCGALVKAGLAIGDMAKDFDAKLPSVLIDVVATPLPLLADAKVLGWLFACGLDVFVCTVCREHGFALHLDFGASQAAKQRGALPC
jgi:hypothetical protein